MDPPWFEMSGRQKKRRHAIFIDGDQIAPAQLNAVVADEYEEGIFKVIRPTCVADELADAIVGVKKIVELSQLEAWRHNRLRRKRRYPARRILPWRME